MIEKNDNILLTGVAHCGSSVVADLYQKIGWKIPDGDVRRETKWIKEFSRQHMGYSSTRVKHTDRIRKEDGLKKRLKKHPSNVLFKDVLLPFAVDGWINCLQSMNRPFTLLVLHRSMRQIEESFRVRNQDAGGRPGAFNFTAREWNDRVEYAWCEWPWKKVSITYEEISQSVKANSINALRVALRLSPNFPYFPMMVSEDFDVSRIEPDHPLKGSIGLTDEIERFKDRR